MLQVREEKVNGVGGARSVSRNSRTVGDNFEHQQMTLGQLSVSRMTPNNDSNQGGKNHSSSSFWADTIVNIFQCKQYTYRTSVDFFPNYLHSNILA